MKVLTLFISIMCSFFFLKGQTFIQVKTENGIKKIVADTSEACNPNLLFAIVSTVPKYEGGLEQLIKELNANINIDQGIKETYAVFFTINCENKAYGFQSIYDTDSQLDENIIKQLNIQQNWTSGIQGNKKVDCTYMITMKVKRGKIKLIKK